MSSTVTFRVIENYNHEHKFEDFREDFLHSNIKVKELCEKYDIGRSVYVEWRDKIFEEVQGTNYVFSRRFNTGGRKKRKRKTLNISGGYLRNLGNNVTVVKSKTRDCGELSYGTYPSRKIAQKVFDALLECDWDNEVGRELLMKYATPISKKCLGRRMLNRCD